MNQQEQFDDLVSMVNVPSPSSVLARVHERHRRRQQAKVVALLLVVALLPSIYFSQRSGDVRDVATAGAPESEVSDEGNLESKGNEMTEQALSLFDSEHWVVVGADGLRGGLETVDRIMTFDTTESETGDALVQVSYFASTPVVSVSQRVDRYVVEQYTGPIEDLSLWGRPRGTSQRDSNVFGILSEESEIRVLPVPSSGGVALELTNSDGGTVSLRAVPWEVLFPSSEALLAQSVGRWDAIESSGPLLGAGFAWDHTTDSPILSLRYECGNVLFRTEWNKDSINVGEQFQAGGSSPCTDAGVGSGDTIEYTMTLPEDVMSTRLELSVDGQNWGVTLEPPAKFG